MNITCAAKGVSEVITPEVAKYGSIELAKKDTSL